MSRSSIRPSVLLPEPDSPTSPRVSPASIARDIVTTARISLDAPPPKADWPAGNVLTKFRACSKGMPSMVANAWSAKIAIVRMPRRTRFLPDSHNSNLTRAEVRLLFRFDRSRENRASKCRQLKMNSKIAQNSGRRLWTSCTRLKTSKIELRNFSLTSEIGGVKTHSFFDKFPRFS